MATTRKPAAGRPRTPDKKSRRRDDQALRESEARYSAIIEDAIEGIYRTSPDGRFLIANPAMAAILGYDSADDLLASVTDIGTQVWADPDERSRFLAELAQKGTIRDRELRFKRKDGRPIWVSSSSRFVRGADGRIAYIEGFIEDITARKQAQDALEESEARYRDIFERSSQGIYRVSLDGKFIFANPATARILGYDSPEDLMNSVTDVAHQIWADPSERAAGIKEVEAGAVVERRDYRLRRKDGSIVWVALGSMPVRGDDGRIVYFDGLIEDIDEHKRAVLALTESEERFRVLAESSLVGIYVLQDGRYAYVNPAMARVFGYSVAEMTGLTPNDIVQPDDQGMVGENIRRRISGEVQSMQYEVKGKHKDGSTRDVEVYGTRLEMNGRPALVGTLIDITERKRAEEALQRSQHLLREVEGIGHVGGTEIDIPTGRRTWTAGLFDIFEIGPGFELTFEKISRFFTPTSRALYERALDRAIRSGEPLELEAEIVTGLGHPRNLHIIGRVDPERRKVYIIYRDVTEQLKNERERLELRTERTHLARVLTVNEVSSSLAHEINQPLGAILNNAEALKALLSGPKSGQKEFPEIVDDIIQDAQRAGNVVRKIRGVVKGGVLGPFEPLSMNGLIDDVLAFLHNNLVLNDIGLHLQLERELPGVRGDRVRLQQVLLNLMTNALDAMQSANPKVLTVRSAKDGPDSIVVSVGDSGPGIGEADQEKLFDPFFTTKKDGLGLGLPICRSIIEEHGGRIWAEDGPDGGAVFSYTLKTDPPGSD